MSIKPVSAFECTDGRVFRDREDALKHEQSLENTKIYQDVRALMIRHFKANNRNPIWAEYRIDNALNAIFDNHTVVAAMLKRYITQE